MSAHLPKIAVDAGSRQPGRSAVACNAFAGMQLRAAEAWSWAAVVVAPIRDDRVVAFAVASA